MAHVVKLATDATTLNFQDGTNYDVQVGGLALPPPGKRQVWGGRTFLRDGSDLIDSRFENRTITITLQILGASIDIVTANIEAIDQMLEAARNRQRRNWGTRVELQVQLNGASNPVFFEVLDGALTLPSDWAAPLALTQFKFLRCQLQLVCRPFAQGVSPITNTPIVLENFLSEPDFERDTNSDGIPDAWTIDTGTGITRSDQLIIAPVKYGLYSLQTIISANTSGGTSSAGIWQNTPKGSFAAGDVVSLSVWAYLSTISNFGIRIDLYYYNAADALLGQDLSTVWQEAATQWNQITLNGKTCPATTSYIKVRLLGISQGATGLGTLYMDAAMLVKAATTPVGFISSRYVYNHHDPATTAGHIDYVDVAGIPGDVPALCNLRLTQKDLVDTNTKGWRWRVARRTRPTLGLFGHMYEAEGATAKTGFVSATEADCGAGLRLSATGATTAIADRAISLTQDYHSGRFRALARVKASVLATRFRAIIGTYNATQFVVAQTGDWVYLYDAGSGATNTPDAVATGTWTVLDLGLVTLPPSPFSRVVPTDYAVRLEWNTTGATADVHFDYLSLLSAEEDYLVVQAAQNSSVANDERLAEDETILIEGISGIGTVQWLSSASGSIKSLRYAGTLPYLNPTVINRFYCHVTDYLRSGATANIKDFVANSSDVRHQTARVEYIPRFLSLRTT